MLPTTRGAFYAIQRQGQGHDQVEDDGVLLTGGGDGGLAKARGHHAAKGSLEGLSARGGGTYAPRRLRVNAVARGW
ncbi:MAG: hypothetical protein IPO67_22045 [Deltaproteobacteria bacterium]|nr:hypothetical protein [Deltaproteobacteria bacterium]